MMKSRYLLSSVVLGILLSVGLIAALSLNAGLVNARAGALSQEQVSTAYVVVRFGNHDTLVRPITFTEPISAFRALELSGLDFSVSDSGWGLFLCSIEEVGDSSEACDNGDRYWATFYWEDDAWAGRMVGITDAMISEDGHVEAFSWSDPDWTAVEPPPAPALTAAWQALAWLQQQQQADGGYGTPGSTAEVLMALGANRLAVDEGVLAYLRSVAGSLTETADGAGKLALALAAHDVDWPLDAKLPMDYFDPTTGAFDAGSAPHALAMLGTAALSQTIPPSATTYLLAQQQPDGGWEWGPGWGTDTNSTALALQALIAAGEPSTSDAVLSGLGYLEKAQNTDGGFPYDPVSEWGTDSDTNSTAYVVQALLAVGEDPLTGTWVISDANPITFLLGMQLADGSFEWQSGLEANQSATQQAIPALLYRPFPIRVSAVELPPSPQPSTEGPSQAGLVVSFGDSVVTRCVTFEETEISGFDLLSRSGLSVLADFTASGVAVCEIEGTGCPVDSCLLCAAPSYWSYWRLGAEGWVYAQQGASAATVRAGDLEGWSWGDGEPPALISFDEVCTGSADETPAAPDPTPASTDAPSPAPSPTPPVPETSEPVDGAPAWSGYLLFGLIAVGLLVGVFWFSRRKG